MSVALYMLVDEWTLMDAAARLIVTVVENESKSEPR